MISAVVLAVACCLCPSASAAGAAGGPKKLLHLSFEDESWVAFSRSRSAVLVDYPELVEGRTGRGAHIARRGESGSIELAGNLDKARGTVSFWYKPDTVQGKDKAVDEGSHVLLSSGAFGKHNTNSMRVWIWNGTTRWHHIRFDMARGDRGRGYCTAPIEHWEAGEWVHIACTWDSTTGIALWVNGQKAADSAVTWSPVDTKTLVIGRATSQGRKNTLAGGAIDELVVYDTPLTAEQIASYVNGTLNAPNADTEPNVETPAVADALTFHLSFETGLDAGHAGGNGTALESRSAAIAPGFRGNGVALPRNGSISYDAAGNILTERGTLSMWLKLNWEPKGNGFPISKVDENAIGKQHDVLTAVPAGDGGKDAFRFELSNFLKVFWESASLWLPVNRQVFAGTWHQYIFTWDEDKRLLRAFLDGKSVHSSARFNANSGEITQLVLGCVSENFGLDGTLDELKIYNYPMTDAEVSRQYESAVGLDIVVLDSAAIRGRENAVRIKLTNGQASPMSGDYNIAVRGTEGQTLMAADWKAAVPAGQSVIKAFAFSPEQTGIYSVSVSREGRTLRSAEGYAVAPKPLCQGRRVISGREPDEQVLLEEIDCVKELGPDKYRDDGECRVVHGAIGSYREAGTVKASGFAYRFGEIEHPGKPHWLEIEYPDDKPRTFYVAVFQEKDGHVDAKGLDTIGVITGVHHPLTMEMQRKRLLFWPDSRNIMVGCYSFWDYDGQSGPALAKIRLYENAGPLPVRQRTAPAGYPERRIGLWQEDPTMTGYAWFSQDTQHDNIDLSYWHTKWCRAIDYLNYSGQNLWNMLVFDYDGDTALATRRIPQSWRASGAGRVPGWADLGAVMLDREGVDFYVAINPRRQAFDKMIPPERRRAADNMRAVSAKGATLVECIGSDDYYTAAYNPLHPVVQEQYEKIVRLYAEKFGKYPRFKGVHFLSTTASSLYFHSLEQGYGDYTIGLFEAETGTRVPVDGNEPRRYSKRHDWLMANAGEEWVRWRTGKVLEFYRKLSNIVREGDDSRQLCISLRGGTTDQQEKWPLDGSGLYEHWRGCGIDFRLYEKEPGILLMPEVVPNRGRIYAEGRSGSRRNEYNWRYTSFSEELPEVLGRFEDRSALISYHNNLEELPHTKQRIPSYWWAFGSWFGRENGPLHCFSTPQPSEEFVLEHLTHILAGSDPRRITHGWWGSPDNGNIAAFARFYSAFRSIPALNFEDVPGAEDPVRVRHWHGNGESFMYLVNRESYPIQYSISLRGVADVTNTQTGSVLNAVPDGDHVRLDIALAPYEVICVRGRGTANILGTAFTVPGPVVSKLEHDVDELGRMIAEEKARGTDVESAEVVRELVHDALGARRYTHGRHLLQSGPVLKLNAQRQ